MPALRDLGDQIKSASRLTRLAARLVDVPGEHEIGPFDRRALGAGHVVNRAPNQEALAADGAYIAGAQRRLAELDSPRRDD